MINPYSVFKYLNVLVLYRVTILDNDSNEIITNMHFRNILKSTDVVSSYCVVSNTS